DAGVVVAIRLESVCGDVHRGGGSVQGPTQSGVRCSKNLADIDKNVITRGATGECVPGDQESLCWIDRLSRGVVRAMGCVGLSKAGQIDWNHLVRGCSVYSESVAARRKGCVE